MISLSGDNQNIIIEAFKSTSRHLNYLLNIYKPFLNQIYLSELQVNKANASDPKLPL